MKDAYGRDIDYLRISLTDRCNLRCSYCMPEEGISFLKPQDHLTGQELMEITAAFRRVGIKKVRLTGGEPALRPDISRIIAKLNRQGFEEITMTSNGTLLKGRIRELKEAGLDRLNLSLDSLDPGRYSRLTRGGNLKDVLDVMDEIHREGLLPLKLNTVLLPDLSKEELLSLADLSRPAGQHVRFIELMPMGPVKDQAGLTGQKVKELLADLKELPHKQGEVAKLYRLKDHVGTIGFITPMSQHFCGECNRLRLSAEGKLRLCLHGPTGLDLKKLLKQGNDLVGAIEGEIENKPLGHTLTEQSFAGANMNEIGG